MDRLALDSFQQICDVLYEAYERNLMILIFGNGGSAALASHMVCDLAKGRHSPCPAGLDLKGVKRLKVVSLTDNVPMLTA